MQINLYLLYIWYIIHDTHYDCIFKYALFHLHQANLIDYIYWMEDDIISKFVYKNSKVYSFLLLVITKHFYGNKYIKNKF